MTVRDVFELCWQIMQDSEDPHIFYPARNLYPWLNEAVEQVLQRRPESRIDSTGEALLAVSEVSSLSDELSLADRWKTALVEWVIMRCFQSDAEDVGDKSQAKIHFELFEKYVAG